MYSLIERYAEKISSNLVSGTHFKDYEYLVTKIKKNQIDDDFKRRYKNYWAMNRAISKNEFYDVYFKCLSNNLGNNNVLLSDIIKKLYPLYINSKKNNTLQVSFSSKLLHMINPNKPIYDYYIKQFYHLTDYGRFNNLDDKIKAVMDDYAFLEKEYNRILDTKLLYKITCLIKKNYNCDILSDIKIIDAIIWEFNSYLDSGAILKKEVIFF